MSDEFRPGEMRVPMPRPTSAFVGEGDVAVSVAASGPRIGRRYNFDVSEEVLAKIGGEALAMTVQKMGEAVAWSKRADVERLVTERMTRDPEFMATIIEAAFTASVKDLLHDRIAAWTDAMMREAVKEAVRDALRSGLYSEEW